MKRPALALSAGILLVALLPGSTMALPIAGALDQSNPAGTATTTAPGIYAQTFTAGKTGLLTAVRLWMTGPDTVGVEIVPVSTGGAPDPSNILGASFSGTPTGTAGWVYFPMVFAAPVIAGGAYAIMVDTADTLSGSGDTYAGGQALVTTGTWDPVSGTLLDFAFGTYVEAQTTALQWDKTQVVAGATTALTLTETFVFPIYSNQSPAAQGAVNPDPLAPAAVWTVKTDAMPPAWFAAATVACSSQIATTDCTLAKVAPGSSVPVTPDGDPVTLTFTGTASPALADVGTGTAKAEGCVAYDEEIRDVVTPQLIVNSCVAAQASVAVVAPGTTAPPVTPPPTATGGSPSSNEPDSSIWLLPLALVALGGAVLFVNRQKRLIR